MIDERQIADELRGLLREFRYGPTPETWGVAEIAEWRKMSEDTVRRKVVCRKGFPKPMYGLPRAWWKDQVLEWFRVNGGKMA